jgi:hypothetical protein
MLAELREGRYVARPGSALLPDLDLALLVSFLELDDQTAAVRAFRAALRARSVVPVR